MNRAIKKTVIDIISNQYQIVKIIDLAQYDLDPESMAGVLHEFAFAEFLDNQRLVVLYHETDYFPSLDCVGNTMYNFLRLCANYSIPLDKIILLTNHCGVESTIIDTAKNICNDSRITVIYTAQWYDFPDDVDPNHSVSDQTYDFLFCCLNGAQRQHRILTLCYLAEYDLLDQGLVSYHFAN